MIMKKEIAKAVLIAALGTIAGCAAPGTREQAAKDEARAGAIRAQHAQANAARDQQEAEATLKAIPPWALVPPKPDESGIYAVGMAEGGKYALALKKASLDAEFEVASAYRQELSGSERTFSRDNGKIGSTESFTRLVDKLVMQVPLTGFEVVQQEVLPIGGAYHAFVLLKLPYRQFNQVLQEQRAGIQDKSVAAAFDDLERRVDKRRHQLQEEQALERANADQ
jgi:hypothetical protein